MNTIVLFLLTFTIQNSWGHGGEDHSKKKSPKVVHDGIVSGSKEVEAVYKKIGPMFAAMIVLSSSV